MQRNGPIIVVIHSFEKEFDLVLGDVGVDVSEELGKLLEVELLIAFEAEALQQAIDVDVFGVYLETEFSHHHL